MLAGKSALCKVAVAASSLEGQIHFVESTHNHYIVCKEKYITSKKDFVKISIKLHTVLIIRTLAIIFLNNNLPLF